MPGWRVEHHRSNPRSEKGKEKAMRALIVGKTASELEKLEKSDDMLLPIAKAIVARFEANERRYPSLKMQCRLDPSRAQEYEDARRLHTWRNHTDASQAREVFKYLDEHMPKWRGSQGANSETDTAAPPIARAEAIVTRCNMRRGLLPREIPRDMQTSPDLVLEHGDALKLIEWNRLFRTNPSSFCPALKEFLDKALPNWINVEKTAESVDVKDSSATGIIKKRKNCYRDNNNNNKLAPAGDCTVAEVGRHPNPLETGEKTCTDVPLQFLMPTSNLSMRNIEKRMPAAEPDVTHYLYTMNSPHHYFFSPSKLQDWYAYRPTSYGNGFYSQRSSLARHSSSMM